MVTTIIIIAVILIFIAGISKAIIDTLNFHYSVSIFKNLNAQFWSPELSLRNKYKNGIKKRGPKFFGSTTFLVWTTDAWHLFGALYTVSSVSALLLLGYISCGWYDLLSSAICYIVLKGISFEYFFRKFETN